jgi:hypothetical protein
VIGPSPATPQPSPEALQAVGVAGDQIVGLVERHWPRLGDSRAGRYCTRIAEYSIRQHYTARILRPATTPPGLISYGVASAWLV